MIQVPYIDFHTHKITNQNGVLECVSCGVPADLSLLQHPFLQVGIHPWDITNKDEQMRQFEKYADLKNCIAIGEIGLDKINGSDWDLQLEVFDAQVKIAKLKRKPIILHCVKAIDEILTVLSQNKFIHPVIFHGFQGSENQAKQLISKGYFLSFGHTLLRNQSKTRKAIQAIKPGSFFLETDNSDLHIKEIYHMAATQLSMDCEVLSEILWKQFIQLFPQLEAHFNP